MSERIFLTLGILITWFATFFIVPLTGFHIEVWKLIVSASVGGLFAGLLVLQRETVIENIIFVVIVLVITGVLSGKHPELGFIFISALISGVIGVITNQINQYAAYKALKSGTPKTAPLSSTVKSVPKVTTSAGPQLIPGLSKDSQ